MKKIIVVVIIGLSVFAFLTSLWAHDVPVTGRWGTPGGVRFYTPAPPEVSVNGSTVSIHFVSPLSGLTISISDGSGIIYQTVVSSNGNNNYTYDLPWTGQPGEYQILMIHGMYGHMGGHFTIE